MMSEITEEDLRIGNHDERMIVANLWSYWAHLSIYRFAIPYCQGRQVLDAGSGSGYGTVYLAKHGASVLGLEVDTTSLRYARARYPDSSARFVAADLNKPLPVADAQVDVVFSSNVFEHIANVDGLAAECARVVRPDGVVIVAVPPITLPWIAEDDMRNYWHVHHLPPAAWHAKLHRFFGAIECFGHTGHGKWGEGEVQNAEIHRGPDQVTIRETDFDFTPVSIQELNGWQCITAVFVCREPRPEPLAETLAERMPCSWSEGALAARVIRQERTRAEAAEARLAAVLSSRSWRLMLRAQAVVKAARKVRLTNNSGG